MITLVGGIVGLGVFWLVLLFFSNRVNFEKIGVLIAPLIIIWRSSKLNDVMDKVFSKPNSSIMKKIGNLSAFIVLLGFFLFPFILVFNLIKYYISDASLLLLPNPIVVIDISILFFVPPLFMVVFIHNFFKAAMAKAEGVKINNYGLIIAVIIPISFLQLSKSKLQKISSRGRLRILSIGIIVNILIAILLVLLLPVSSSFIAPFYDKADGAIIIGIDPGSPAEFFDIHREDVIIALQRISRGSVISTQNINSSVDMVTSLRLIPPGEIFNLILSTFVVITIVGDISPADSNILTGTYLGIHVYDYQKPVFNFMSSLGPYYYDIIFNWMINFSLILSLFNLLPLPIGAGGQIFEEILNRNPNQNELKLNSIRKSIYLLAGLLVFANLYITILQ